MFRSDDSTTSTMRDADPQSIVMGGSKSRVYRFFCESLPVLTAIARYAPELEHVVFAWVGALVHFWQLAAFVVNPHFRWGYALDTDVAYVAYFSHVAWWDPALLGSASSVVVHALMWPLVILIAVVYAGIFFGFRTQSVPSGRGSTSERSALGNRSQSSGFEWFVAALRVVVRSLQSWALIPVVHLAGAGAVCNADSNHAVYTDKACWSVDHVVLLLGAALLLAVLAPLTLLNAACDFDPSPVNSHPRARAHSFLDLTVWAHAVGMTLTFHVTVFLGYPNVFTAIFAAASLLVAALFAFALPFYDHRMNRLYCANYTAAATVALIAFAAAQSATLSASQAAGPLALAVAPLAYLFGLVACDVRRSSRCQYDLYLCAQGIQPDTLHQPPCSCDGLDPMTPFAPVDASEGPGQDSESEDGGQWDVFGDGQSHGSEGQGPDARRLIDRRVELPAFPPTPYITRCWVPTDVELAARFVTAYSRVLHERPDPEAIRAGAGFYNSGLLRFPTSATVIVDFATYVWQFYPALGEAALMQLQRASSVDGGVAQLFRSRQLITHIRFVLGIRDKTHQHHMMAAQRLHAEALQQLSGFWTKLMEPSVDIAQASEIADRFAAVRAQAVEEFRAAIMAQHAVDGVIVGRVGEFFEHVMQDTEAAVECGVVARELEERQAARKGKTVMEAEMATFVGRVMGLLTASRGDQRASGPRRGQWLLPQITGVFLCLLVLSGVLLATTIQFSAVEKKGLDRSVAANVARTIPQQFLYTLYEYEASPSAARLATLRALADQFTAEVEKLTDTGEALAGHAKDATLFADRLVLLPTEFQQPPATPAGLVARSQWSAAAAVSSAFDTALAALNASTAIPDRTSAMVRVAVPQTVAEAFSRALLALQDERHRLAGSTTLAFSLCVVAALAVTAVCLVAFLFNFQQTALTKMFTFQLFTLIPFDSLERLATDTKEKLDQAELKYGLLRSGSRFSIDTTRAQALVESSRSDRKKPSITEEPKEEEEEDEDADSTAQPTSSAASTVVVATSRPPEDLRRESTQMRWTIFWREVRHRPLQGILKKAPKLANTDGSRGGGALSHRSSAASHRSSVAASQAPSGNAFPTRKVRINQTVEVFEDDDEPGPDEANGGHKAGGSDLADVPLTSPGLDSEGDDADAETLAAGDRWRANAGLHVTRRPQRTQGTAGVGRSRWVHLVPVGALVAAVLLVLTSVGLVVAVSTDKRHSGALQRAEQAGAALVFTADQLETLAVTAPSFVVGGLRETYEEFVALRGRCGAPLLLEPLFNVTDDEHAVGLLLTTARALEALLVFDDTLMEIAAFAHGNVAATNFPRTVSSARTWGNTTRLLEAVAHIDTVVADAARLAANEPQNVTSVGAAKDAVLLAVRALLGSVQRRELQGALVRGHGALERHLLEKVRADITDGKRTRFALGAAVAGTVAVVLFLVAMQPATAVLHTPVLRTAALATLLVFILAAGSAWFLWAEERIVRDVLQDHSDLVQGTVATASRRPLTIGSAINYVLNGAAARWAAYRFYAAPAVLTAERQHLMDNTYMTVEARAEGLRRLAAATSALQARDRMEAVAHALTMSAYEAGFQRGPFAMGGGTVAAQAEPVMLEPAMVAFLRTTDWDVDEEDGGLYNREIFFRSGHAHYTTRTADLALPTTQKADLAVTTLSDARAANAHHLVHDAQGTLRSYLLSHSRRHAIAAAGTADLASLAALVLWCAAALGCVYCSVAAYHMALLVRAGLEAQDAQDTTIDRVLNSDVFRRALRNSLVSLSAIAVALLVILILGVYTAQLNRGTAKTLEAAGQREFLVAQSYTFARLGALPDGDVRRTLLRSVDPGTCALRAVDALAGVQRELWFAAGGERINALGRDSGNDALNFGPADPAPFTDYALSFATTQCSATVGGAAPAFGPFGGLALPVDTASRQWREVVAEYAADPLATLLAQLQGKVGPLVAALRQSQQLLRDDGADNLQLLVTVLQAVIGFTMALLLVVYAALFVPMTMRLAAERQTTMALLRVIPLDVRDQVPAIIEFIETGTMDTAAEIRRKFEMNEKLLRNILPQAISRRLKGGESPICDVHPCITILFTDFVGFTSISSGKTAEQIVDFLNEVFVEFDNIAETMELDKIKTIGDAYFMAGGLDPRITDHAMRVIEASFFMFRALDEHNARHQDRDPLRMRLGIHTGPAVAGVIGTTKVAYDLWGDSVAIANAMESTGVPQHIHISESTLSHVRGFYKVDPRGELPKEKGVPSNMPATFLVLGRLVPTPYQHIIRPRLEKAKLEKSAPASPTTAKPKQ